MEPVSALVKAASLAQKVAKALPSSRKDLESAWQEQIADAALEASAAVRRLAEQLGADAIAQIEAKLHTREVQAFTRVMFDAAVHAVTRERMLMLCAALAGGLVLDEDAEMKSRVARAVLVLEPSDVRTLREITHANADGDTQSPDRALYYLPDSRAALTQACCIAYIAPPGDHHLPTSGVTVVTEIGYAVVRFVDGWKPDAAPADQAKVP